VGSPAVVCRVQSGALWFDLRSVFPEDDGKIAEAIAAVVRG
jgi:hypothetical protein